MNQMNQIKQRAAQVLTNYSGGQGARAEYGMVNPNGYFGYNGGFDEFVSFDGSQANQDFNSEINTHRSFELTFDTTGAAASFEVILFPSVIPSTGVLIAGDGAVGGGATGFQPVTFSGTPSTLRNLQEWVKFFPSRVTGLQLSSSNQQQHSVTADLYPKNPWRKAVQPRTIFFSHHSNEYKNQLTITTVKEQFQLDAKTEMRVVLRPNTTGTIAFYFGAVMDTAEALKKKASAAGANA